MSNYARRSYGNAKQIRTVDIESALTFELQTCARHAVLSITWTGGQGIAYSLVIRNRSLILRAQVKYKKFGEKYIK